MAEWFNQVRYSAYPRSRYRERGPRRPPRASSVILGMTVVVLAVAFLAKALTAIFTAT